MADISSNFLGIKSPNPYWLASAPPTDKKINVLRAFEAGWGGVVWKTLGSQIKNVSSRYSAVNFNGTRVMGFNNIELISDRPLDINLAEIKECIKLFPDRAMVVSLMADNDRESWHELIKKVEDTGAHGLELNFGCPHGMTERGMGAAVGQDPEIARMVVGWVMEKATIPVITKLTPNVHSVVPSGKACVEAGSNGLSLINTIQSVTGIDLDTLVPQSKCSGQICLWRLLRTGCKTNCFKNADNYFTGSGRHPVFLFRVLVALVPGGMRWNLCCWVHLMCRCVQLQ
jgi:dihydropyrimidine dehydrogenase (NAD+) subunit PreA